jgi:hypothetical protein
LAWLQTQPIRTAGRYQMTRPPIRLPWRTSDQRLLLKGILDRIASGGMLADPVAVIRRQGGSADAITVDGLMETT